MDSTNSADECRRLEELYAQMSDEQIADMARKLDDFTDLAQRVLRAEMSKRRLDGPRPETLGEPREVARQALLEAKDRRGEGADRQGSPEAPTDPAEAKVAPELVNLGIRGPLMNGFDPSAYDLVPVWGAADESHARQIIGILDSAGIKSWLGPENVESADAYHGTYEDGVEIKVMKFQAKLAMDGLRRLDLGPVAEEPAESADYAMFCPRCNSREVIFQGLSVEPGKVEALDAKYEWTCADCGHRWKDNGIERVA